jgi:hypothetical protein
MRKSTGYEHHSMTLQGLDRIEGVVVDLQLLAKAMLKNTGAAH